MREIKFRGKRIDNGKWVIGDLVRIPTDAGSWSEPPSLELTWYITDSRVLTHEWVEIATKTVGQFTGLKDKNGVEIYEGEKLKLSAEEAYISEGISTDYDWEMEGTVIEWGGCFWVRVDDERKVDIPLYDISESDISVEIIGNIYESPKLLNA